MSKQPDVDETAVHELQQWLYEDLPAIAPAPERQLAMRQALLGRVGLSLAEHLGVLTVRLKDGVWKSVAAGIRYKLLWQGVAGNSVLIEFAPGAALPAHRHNWLEEGIVLSGDLAMGELKLGVGDYHLSPVASRHHRIMSQLGALAFLRGTSLGHKSAVLKELLGGLLPMPGLAPSTVYAADTAQWQVLATGVQQKIVYADAVYTSRFYLMEPEAVLPPEIQPIATEYLVVKGEVFLGDSLLRAGEYQLVPAGHRLGEVYTDVGATLFVRGKTP